MARISHLYTSITALPPEELTKLFLDIRAARRIRPSKKTRDRKANASVKRKKSPPKIKSRNDAFNLISNLSPQDKAKLISLLTS